MRRTALAMCLCGLLAPTAAVAQGDGGIDGSYVAPSAVEDGEPAGHTGSSLDPHGNMGDVGRTGRDAGPSDAGPSGAEGSSGQNPPEDHEPPLPGPSAPSP
jgi:hypothetical protein